MSKRPPPSYYDAFIIVGQMGLIPLDLARRLAPLAGLRNRLAAQDASNSAWQRDLSISHNKIGDVLQAQGDGSGALAAYRASLAIGERLAAQDASNTQWRYDLAVSHEQIGNVLVLLGKTTEGVESLQTALRLYETLAQQFPTMVDFARAPFVVHTRLGRLSEQQNDFVAALQAYDSALGYIERLAQRHPTHIPWQREHAQALNRYAWTLLTAKPPAQRDAEKALPLAERAVRIAEQLAEQMSAVTQAALRDTLAMAYHLTGDHAHAIALLEQALHLLPESATEQEAVEMRQTLTNHLATFRAALQPARK